MIWSAVSTGSPAFDAAARATVSSTIAPNIRQHSGVSRMTPIGERVSAVMPATAQISAYFSQSARRMSVESWASIAARARAAPRRAARDQRHALAGARELRAEVAADAARAHDHDVHGMMIHCAQNMSASLERRVAVDAARAAGHLLQSELHGSRRIAYKGSPTNLVTEMDARAEELIVGRLLAAFPEDGILAEERGARHGRSGRRWIIDPLDGTTNYAHGLPIFGVSIGLEADRQVQVGVVFDPNRDELFVAERGRGATVNDQPLAASATATLGESLLATGFPYNVRETADNNLREYAAFAVRTRGVRRMGSAVLYLAWLATGRLDGYWELTLGPWDAAAGSLLVEEAGGRVTNLTGGALDLDAPALVASNGRIHDAM